LREYFDRPSIPRLRGLGLVGTKYRFIVLEDIGGETVTIAFGGPAVDFEEFLPEAQDMLDTVEWKGA
jgi:hypothetical protein